MADAETPVPKPFNKPLALLVLTIQCVGTALLLAWGFWQFYEEKRGPAMWLVSLGMVWFIFFGWRLHWMLHPKPSE